MDNNRRLTYFTNNLHRSASVTDGVSYVNQTNVALKGIIGIAAMSGISRVVQQSTDADYYQVRVLVELCTLLRV